MLNSERKEIWKVSSNEFMIKKKKILLKHIYVELQELLNSYINKKLFIEILCH